LAAVKLASVNSATQLLLQNDPCPLSSQSERLNVRCGSDPAESGRGLWSPYGAAGKS
jgi:hypothetical protein